MNNFPFASRSRDKPYDFDGLPVSLIADIPFSRVMKTVWSMVNFIWDFDVEDKGDSVVIKLDEDMEFTKRDINIFFYCLNYCPNIEEFQDYYIHLLPNYPDTIAFDMFVKKPAESGQAKILLGVLEGLVEAPPKIGIIVIGSASLPFVVGGRTYDTVAQMFSSLGYSGVIDLYDPLESSCSFKVGNFLVNKISQIVVNFACMRMSDGTVPFAIFDDAFVQDYGVKMRPKPSRVQSYVGPFRAGSTKYMVSSVGRRYYIDFCMSEHSHVEKINKTREGGVTPIGGGTVEIDDVAKTMKFYGVSETYGPVNYNLLSSICLHPHLVEYDCSFYLGDGYRDHDPKKTVLANSCRVSIKALEGENASDCEVRNQFYYSKRERRMVKNFPPIRKIGLQVGDNCEACVHLGKVLSAINSYNGNKPYDAFKYLMAGHVVRTCFKETGIKQASKISLVRGYAWKQLSYDIASSDYLKLYPKSTLEDFARIMKFTKVGVRTRAVAVNHPSVQSLISKGGAKKWGGVSWEYYDSKGKKCDVKEQYLCFEGKTFKPHVRSHGSATLLRDWVFYNHGGPFQAVLGEVGEEYTKVTGEGILMTYNEWSLPKSYNDMLMAKTADASKVDVKVWFFVSSYRGYTLWSPVRNPSTNEAVLKVEVKEVTEIVGANDWAY